MPAARKSYSLSFLDHSIETPSSMTFRFSTAGSGFIFESNQAIRLRLPGVDDPWGPSRLFSLSSSPTEEGLIAITCKMTGSPYKEGLRKLRPGDRVDVQGPLGHLLYDANRPAVMIAGGVGISPFRGMIRCSVDRRTRRSIDLVFSARVPEEFAFRSELDHLASTRDNIRIHYTVTRPAESKADWQGRTGRITAPFLRELVQDLDAPVFYVVGLPEMVETTTESLRTELSIPEERVLWEPFHGY